MPKGTHLIRSATGFIQGKVSGLKNLAVCYREADHRQIGAQKAVGFRTKLSVLGKGRSLRDQF